MWISVNLVEEMNWREIVVSCCFFHFDICSYQVLVVFHWTVISSQFQKLLHYYLLKTGFQTSTKVFQISLKDFFFSFGNVKRTGLRIPYIHLFFTCLQVWFYFSCIQWQISLNLSRDFRDFSHTSLSTSIPIDIGMRRKKITNNTLIVSFSSKGLFNLNNLI